MGRHYQILLPLLSLFWTRVELTDLFPLTYQAQILKVLDGDTIELSIGKSKYRARLLYLDAPELKQKTWNNRISAGVYAQQCLMRLLKDQEQIQLHGFDIYRRALVEVGEVNFKMVEQGCTSLYPHSVFKSKKEKFEYVRAYFKARDQRIGLWKEGGFKNPMSFRKDLKRKSKTSSSGQHFIR